MQPLARCTVVLSLLALLGAWSAPRLMAQTSTVRCESQGTVMQQCRIPANAQVTLARTLSQEACRRGHNWDVAANFVWVNGGCRADFTVTSTGYVPGPGQGNASANPNQLRACRSEADRRMPGYGYDQIAVQPERRDGSVAYVRWRAGPATGMCAVHANGRVLQFTTDAGAGGGGGGNVGPGTTVTIVCESQRTERKECRVPAGSRVRLSRQISQNPCRLNDTYGQSPEYVWVAEGCRGEFEVVTGGGQYPGNPGTIRTVCVSSANNRRQCSIPAGAQATLVRQMSNVACTSGQTWGVGPDYIWVARGCAGEFAVTGGGYQGGNGPGYPAPGGTTTRIVCESKSVAREQCQVAGGTAVRLVKQYSINPCRLNQSFGLGFGHMWVSNGCRGEFEVTVAGGTAPGNGGVTPAPGTGTGLPDRVVCESKSGERTECRVKVGAQVKLARQLSTAACTQGNTWGYGYGMVWVTKGCRGEFEVR